MEALILGWYILSTTGSVQQLVAVAALAWLGSLFSPFFGIVGDRIGHRTLLCITRSGYALFAAVLTALTLSGALAPWHIFVIAALTGLMRPSDMMIRNGLVGQTMRRDAAGAPGLPGPPGWPAWPARLPPRGAGRHGRGVRVVTAMYIAAPCFRSVSARPPSAARTGATHPLSDWKAGFATSGTSPTSSALPWRSGQPARVPFVLAASPRRQGGLRDRSGRPAILPPPSGRARCRIARGGHRPLAAARRPHHARSAGCGRNPSLRADHRFALGPALLFRRDRAELGLTPLPRSCCAARIPCGRVMGVRLHWGLLLGLVAAGPLIEQLAMPPPACSHQP
jgi:hypothetical protein